MTHQRQNGVIFSALLHILWIAFIILGLPLLATKQPPPEPIAISVELLPITGITNVKPSDSMPAPEEKKPDKPAEQKKPAPPVKTAEAPPPPPPPKPAEVPKPPPPKPEKKPEPKKPEKKPKPEDLAAVLAAVKDTAQKQTDKPKKPSEDTSKDKTKSTQYNASLPMSMSEKDAIKSQFAKCWSVPAGAKDAQGLAVLLNIELAQDGSVVKVEIASASKDRYNHDTFYRAAAESAMRAVHECSPIQNLPPEKYETWHLMELNFDPKEMLQ